FETDELARQVIARRLTESRNGVGREALPGRHANVDAVLEAFGAEIRTPFERSDDGLDRRRCFWRHADFAVAAERERTQVSAVVQAVRNDDLFARRVDLVLRIRDLHAIDACRVEQAASVIAQPEDDRAVRRRVGALALEYR